MSAVTVFLMMVLNARSQDIAIQSVWEHNRSDAIRILAQYAEKNSIAGLIRDDHKCGFWISVQMAEQWNNFSQEQKERLRDLQAIRSAQKDTIIGSFRILYDTTGINEPALLDENLERIPNTARAYVDSVGKYLNYAWTFMIDTLGYEHPPFQYGNSQYVISIEELGSTLYGETTFDLDADRIGNYNPPRFTSFIRIDNDYFGFVQSSGLAGLKVTLAHELHHAIQIGSYGIRGSDMFFYEITSTWMEDVIFNDINDYYQYLSNSPFRRSHFAYPDAGFVRADGSIEYSRAIWGKFVEKKYDRNVMLSAWNNLKSENALTALDHSLLERGSSFRSAFAEWTSWNLNTGNEADTVKYYSEGRHYPVIAQQPVIVYSQTPRAFTDTIDAVSSVYQPVCVVQSPQDICAQEVRMVVTVMNLNIRDAFSSLPFIFMYEMAPAGDDSYRKLSNGIYVRLIVPDRENWTTQETIPTLVEDVVVYPNPYRGNALLHFRLPPVKSSSAALSVYTVGMDRLQSREVSIESVSFEPVIRWDGKSADGNALPSGIYIYVISVDGIRYTGKFAVIRD